MAGTATDRMPGGGKEKRRCKMKKVMLVALMVLIAGPAFGALHLVVGSYNGADQG